MQAVILETEKFEELVKQVDVIQKFIRHTQRMPVCDFIDNVEFIKIMRISKRTAQAWRDEGLISFSQIGGKIYYRMSDIQNMLDKNCKPAFKSK